MNALTLIERQMRHWDRIAAALKKSAPGGSLAEISRRPALTISGPVGSGRERLALALCKELEYEMWGREILEAVANDLRCQRVLLDSLDERVQSNLELMFESLIHGREIDHAEYIRALVRVLGSLAEKGGAVIVGRCGGAILGNKAGLRILMEAPLELRVRRIMEWRSLSESEARDYVLTRDEEQKKFCRRYFRCEMCNPMLFDLAINTERIEPEAGVAIVRAALKARGIEIYRPGLHYEAHAAEHAGAAPHPA